MSAHEDVTPWVDGLTVGEVLHRTAQRFPDNDALVFPALGMRTTWAELDRWVHLVRTTAEDTAGARFVARVGPDCERCPVRASCPVNESGRPVPDG